MAANGGGESRKQQREAGARVARTLVLLVILTTGSLYIVDGDVLPPHGNPLVFAAAVSWLVAFFFAFVSSTFFKSVSPASFALAARERDGGVYDRGGLRTFRWLLLHSPFGWINPNLYLNSRTDCHRLLREMNAAEGVHWLAGLLQVALAIWFFVDGHAPYGYSMLVINVPFNVYPIMLQRWNRGRLWRLALTRPEQSSESIPSA
jgi:hypothetical protein